MACQMHWTLILQLAFQLGELFPDSVLRENCYFFSAIYPSDNLFFPVPLKAAGYIFNIRVNLIWVPLFVMEGWWPSEHRDIIQALSLFLNDFRLLLEFLYAWRMGKQASIIEARAKRRVWFGVARGVISFHLVELNLNIWS
jgi:hypothetical protein